jgi:hypothetical protein
MLHRGGGGLGLTLCPYLVLSAKYILNVNVNVKSVSFGNSRYPHCLLVRRPCYDRGHTARMPSISCGPELSNAEWTVISALYRKMWVQSKEKILASRQARHLTYAL